MDAQRILRYGIGITMVTYGVTQIFRPQQWSKYVPRKAEQLLPIKETPFMQLHGLMNAGLGIMFMTKGEQDFVARATLLWWLSILPFAFYEDWQSGMRDISIISGIIAVILLSGPRYRHPYLHLIAGTARRHRH